MLQINETRTDKETEMQKNLKNKQKLNTGNTKAQII